MPLPNKELHNRKNSIAPDMFNLNYVQVFSRKKGDYLGTVILGEEGKVTEQEEAQEEPTGIKTNKNQLSLF